MTGWKCNLCSHIYDETAETIKWSDLSQDWTCPVANFFKVTTEEIKDFARLSGNENVHFLSEDDICTTNSEISNHTNIQHV